MDNEPDPLFFLVRYVDYTVDMIALWPGEIRKLRDQSCVRNLNKLPNGKEPLALDRDHLFGVKKLKDLNDDD